MAAYGVANWISPENGSTYSEYIWKGTLNRKDVYLSYSEVPNISLPNWYSTDSYQEILGLEGGVTWLDTSAGSFGEGRFYINSGGPIKGYWRVTNCGTGK